MKPESLETMLGELRSSLEMIGGMLARLKEENESEEKQDFPPAPPIKEKKEKEKKRKSSSSSSSCENEKSPFTKPSKEEIENYLKAKEENRFTAEEFLDYYEAAGWRIAGVRKMKDWKSAVRCWIRRKDKDEKAQTHRRGARYESPATRTEREQKERRDALKERTEEALNVCRLESEARKFLKEWTPEHGAEVCKPQNMEAIFLGSTPVLGRIKELMGDEVARVWMMRQVLDVLEFAGIAATTTAEVLESMSEALLERCLTLKPSELIYFFHTLKKGDYIELNSRTNGLSFQTALTKFQRLRINLIEKLERDRKEKEPAAPTMNRLQWLELKRREQEAGQKVSHTDAL